MVYIDILILNREARFVCAIENKIFASEWIGDSGISQLTSYRKVLDLKFGLPSENERPHWTPENYKTVLELVEQTIEHKATALSEDVRVFLRQYAATLRKRGNIVPESNEIAKLARKIYLEHREAIDLIKDHEPNWNAETVQILKESVAKQRNWLLDLSNNSYVRFRSADWDQFERTQSGTGWAPGSNALLLLQFRFNNTGFPYLDLGLSPLGELNQTVRVALFEAIRQHPRLFRPIHNSLPDGWAILHEEQDCILDDADYGTGWDDGTTRSKIEAWVKNFAENEFPAMNEVIVNCLREYEAEQPGQ